MHLREVDNRRFYHDIRRTDAACGGAASVRVQKPECFIERCHHGIRTKHGHHPFVREDSPPPKPLSRALSRCLRTCYGIAWAHSSRLSLPLERCLELRRGMAVRHTRLDYLEAEIDYFCLNLDTGKPCRFPARRVLCRHAGSRRRLFEFTGISPPRWTPAVPWE